MNCRRDLQSQNEGLDIPNLADLGASKELVFLFSLGDSQLAINTAYVSADPGLLGRQRYGYIHPDTCSPSCPTTAQIYSDVVAFIPPSPSSRRYSSSILVALIRKKSTTYESPRIHDQRTAP